MAKGDGHCGAFSNEADAIAQGLIEPVTMANLLAHYRKYGLDNHGTGHRGRDETYATYTKARADALIHVARSRLTEEAYIQVLEAVGYGHMADKARQDWKELHDGKQAG